MVSILLALNVVICVALIILILLQRSDPASGGMFGGTGGGGQPVIRNPLARPTAILAGLFLVFSVLAAVLNKGEGHASSSSIMSGELAAPAPLLPGAALLPATASPTTVSATTPSSPAPQQ